MKVLRVAVAGVGGFASQHHHSLYELERQGECTVVATCDPSADRRAEAEGTFHFASRGTRVYPTLEELLDHEELDLVTLPTPIPLHAGMHRAAVDARVPVYLEKPPTLDHLELEAMLEVERRAVQPTQVGFNFVGDPLRREIKRRIVAGEFGAVRGASLVAVWPRSEDYYARADWAGSRKAKDSPIGNAMAHFVQDLLFLLGAGAIDAVARPARVEAKLFRARPIESFDTAFLSAETQEGKSLRIAATHAGHLRQWDRLTVHTDRAKIEWDAWHSATVRWNEGPEERHASPWKDYGDVFRENLRGHLQFLRGDRPRPTTRLDDCRGFVEVHEGAWKSGIEDFPRDRVTSTDGHVVVRGLDEELEAFVR